MEWIEPRNQRVPSCSTKKFLVAPKAALRNDSAAKPPTSEKCRFRWGSETSPYLKEMRCRPNVREKVFHSSRKTTQGGVLQQNQRNNLPEKKSPPRLTSAEEGSAGVSQRGVGFAADIMCGCNDEPSPPWPSATASPSLTKERNFGALYFFTGANLNFAASQEPGRGDRG